MRVILFFLQFQFYNGLMSLGLSAAEAKRQHIKLLRKEDPTLKNCADGARNPSKKWIYHKFKTWRDCELGGLKFDDHFFR